MDESRVSKKFCEDYPTAKSDRPRDRLSELSDSLILVILSLLEMKYVVRTTILSKRWKDVWTTVPCLDFCGENWRFIDEAIAKWKGDKILKFSIRFWRNYPPSDFLDSWLFVPIEKQVENLFIDLNYSMDTQCCVPQRLYSCTSITKLFLSYCNLKIEENVNVQWNQLKSLEIDGSDCLSEDALNRILSGAPLLEELVLSSWNTSENLNIRSTSLKMLKIDMDIYDFDDFEGNASVLKICGPNLVSLDISRLWLTRCLLNVPSLTNASLGFDYRHYYFMLNKPPHYTELEEIMRQAFLSLSHVEKLTLNAWAIKFLVDEMKKENFLLFPKLEMLIFEQDEYSCNWSNCYSLAPNTNTIFPSLSLSLLQLKTIVITWDVRDASIFVAVEILLENARALEKMVIRLRKHKAYPEMKYILALEKMMSMRRASPYVKVIIRRV